jgi:electron transport complex protein RnfB
VTKTSPQTHLTEQIDALLPQTQCRRCGYNGCRPYAEAIANGSAEINQCPPGGEEGILALAKLLKRPFKALNPDYGGYQPSQVAFILEQDCIGCAKCIAACPVDAILGAAKFIHTVIADECTGCEICVAPCPVDCIVMQAAPNRAVDTDDRRNRARLAKRRHEARCLRKTREAEEKLERLKQKKAVVSAQAC